MSRTRRAVVLGGAGFLGRRLVSLLARDGASHPDWPEYDSIHVADLAPFVPTDSLRRALDARGITLSSSRVDITAADSLRGVLAGADTVFHLASMVHVGLTKNPAIDRVNIDGAKNVAGLCRELGVRSLVYTSSEDVALSDVPAAGIDESTPYPRTLIHDYVRTKIEGERAVLAADGKDGLRTCSIRPVHIYGPEDPHAIETSLRAFASGTVPFRLGSGHARFDVVYVDNVAHAHLLAAAKLSTEEGRATVGGRAYFANEGYAPNYFDWLEPYAAAARVKMPALRLPDAGVRLLARAMEAVFAVTGREVPVHRFHFHVLCQDFFFDGSRARDELGYSPLVSVDEARERTVRWVETLRLA